MLPLLLLFILIPGIVSAEDSVADETVIETDYPDRKSQVYTETAYDLMTYAEDSWWQWIKKTGTSAVSLIKNFLWMINVIIARITLMIIYQLFSLDIVELTKDSVFEIASSTAVSLINNLVTFALAIAGTGIVIRAYIKQDWQVFFKILSLVVLSLVLLFSIQSKKFNYINVAHSVSVGLENAIMKVNPTLLESERTEDESVSDSFDGKRTAILIENKAYDSLLYKPYLLLQYGSTNEDVINDEGSMSGDETRIAEYLNASSFTNEGQKQREKIAKREFQELNNENVFAGNVFQSSAYILGISVSTIIQAVVFFIIALVRIILQFAFIFMMLLVPIMLFLSIFPTFEGLIGQFIKGTFMIIMIKGIVVFFVLVGTSFITLSYQMADLSSDVYYRIFIQIIFSVGIILMLAKRQFVFDMLQGASPSLHSMGAGEGMTRNMVGRLRNNRRWKQFNPRQKQDKNQEYNESENKIAKRSINKTDMGQAKPSQSGRTTDTSPSNKVNTVKTRQSQTKRAKRQENPYQTNHKHTQKQPTKNKQELHQPSPPDNRHMNVQARKVSIIQSNDSASKLSHAKIMENSKTGLLKTKPKVKSNPTQIRKTKDHTNQAVNQHQPIKRTKSTRNPYQSINDENIQSIRKKVNKNDRTDRESQSNKIKRDEIR